jgi:hypothetical protein
VNSKPPAGLPPAGLEAATAQAFASRALDNIDRAYPHKLDHVIASAADAVTPQQLHPSFHGSFDWHSCVHMHWLLARIRRQFPQLRAVAAIDGVFDRHLAAAPIAAELAYALRAHTVAFERPYGWAWLLKLASELIEMGAPGQRWAGAVRPLADHFAARFIEFLPNLRYPVRHGVHSNTAFSLLLALDYARIAGDGGLEAACIAASSRFYAADRDLPAQWEPSGADFLSPSLVEANLMRCVLERPAFERWLGAALPAFARATPATLFSPARVDDRRDPQLVHLDGLNLSRAWNLDGIAAGLAPDDPRGGVARQAADAHRVAGCAGVASDDFVGAHWLASFAMLALDAQHRC